MTFDVDGMGFCDKCKMAFPTTERHVCPMTDPRADVATDDEIAEYRARTEQWMNRENAVEVRILARLDASEKRATQYEAVSEALAEKLDASEKAIEALRAENAAILSDKADEFLRMNAELAASEKELNTLRPIVTNALCIIQYNKAAMDAALLKHLAEPIIIQLKDGEMLSDDVVAKIKEAVGE